MKYIVYVQHTYEVPIEVEAETKQDAQAKAEEIISAGCYSDNEKIPEAEYFDTSDRDNWYVEILK